MEMVKAVVIDDERSNRELIIRLLKEMAPEYEMVGEAEDVAGAFEIITRTKPDVVFLDVRMPDGTGFDLLAMFKEVTFPVVFISGFDSYALKAFEFNALDYVLKPIDPEKFRRTLQKIEITLAGNSLHFQKLNTALRSYDSTHLIITKVPIHNGGKVILLKLEDVVFIRSEDGCTMFRNILNEQHTSSKQLSDFDFIFETHPFLVKVNKGVVININHIESYSKGLNCFVYLKGGYEFEISRRKKGEILELLAQKRTTKGRSDE